MNVVTETANISIDVRGFVVVFKGAHEIASLSSRKFFLLFFCLDAKELPNRSGCPKKLKENPIAPRVFPACAAKAGGQTLKEGWLFHEARCAAHQLCVHNLDGHVLLQKPE